MARNRFHSVNLTNAAVWPRELSIVNDIIRSTSLELAQYKQQDLIRAAERSRLIAEATEHRLSKFSRFVRLPVGRAIVATGRKVQGCTAAPQFEEVDTSPALKLAR